MGELHSEAECQSRASSLQSIPLETGAPYPSLLNISLLQLTPSVRGNAAQNENPALGEGPRARGLYACCWWLSRKTGCALKQHTEFFMRLARWSTLSLNDENMWKESGSLCHLLLSLRETNHH